MLVISALAAIAFALVWFDRYYIRLDCFNEMGRCFDVETGVVYHEQSGMVWMGLAVAAAIFCAISAIKIIRK